MNVIGHKYIFLSLSGLLVAAAVLALSAFGLKQGIDFTGGTLWQIVVPGQRLTTPAEIHQVLAADLKLDDALVTVAGDSRFLIRLKETSEADHQRYLAAFRERFGALDELGFESIGSAIGGELRRKSLWAFFIVLAAISLYVAFAFRAVSRPVRSWKYGIITLATLFHDALIPTGLFAYLGWVAGTEIGVDFIVAILVVMGFSVHDTIVVFDRIRENLKLTPPPDRPEKNGVFAALVNRSVNQTFARSINTSLTLVLVLAALYLLGASALRPFTLVILVGAIVGIYSSIFVASPLLVLWRS